MRIPVRVAPAIFLLALALLSTLIVARDTARAAGFHVNVTHDGVDANPGDLVCETAPGNGVCTLRAAIMEANALPGSDLVTLGEATYEMTLGDDFPEGDEDTGASGDFDIFDDLTIDGIRHTESIVVGESLGNLLDIGNDATVEISGVSLEGVRNTGPGQGTCGSAIRNKGTLTLSRVAVRDNLGRHVGAICNHGTLTIEDSSVADNRTALSGNGAGIYNSGSLELVRVLIANNSATFNGGGIYNVGEVSINESLIAGNAATGAISEHEGGGIYNSGTMTVVNTTISDNFGEGGGIANHGTASLINATITANMPDTGATDGGIRNEGSLTLTNTIVAHNEGGDCAQPVTSAGHNLDSDGTCGLDADGDLSGIDPLLGELADNGGPTMTGALLEGSPAIDAGDGAACPDTDQRGAPRPADGDGDTEAECDIGAYEAAAAVPTPTPTGTPVVLPSKRADIDCDGDADTTDALTLLWFVAGEWLGGDNCPLAGGDAQTADSPIPPSSTPRESPIINVVRGDINCDGSVDVLDALAILRYVAGLPVELPGGCGDLE